MDFTTTVCKTSGRG